MLKWIRVALFLVTLNSVAALICMENICQRVNCTDPSVLSVENQPPCKENQRFNSYGTYCGCCPACVDILDVGSHCYYSEDLDSPPPLSECKKGLDCVHRRCVLPQPTTTSTKKATTSTNTTTVTSTTII